MKCYKRPSDPDAPVYYITGYSNDDEYMYCYPRDYPRGYWQVGVPSWTDRIRWSHEDFQEVSPLEILVVMGINVEEVVRSRKCLESP